MFNWDDMATEHAKQRKAFEKTFLRLLRAWDCEAGSESDLNVLDLSTAVHQAVQKYLDEAQKRLENE